MNASKIRIKLGAIEVEYEGSESFLKEELPSLLSAVSELYSKSHASEIQKNNGEQPPITEKQRGATLQATTGSIAAKLQAKSGSDLVLAAAARLTLVLNMETFSRQKITDEMKTASAYFKESYRKNLSNYLNTLVKEGKLNEPSQSNYALTVAARTELEPRLV